MPSWITAVSGLGTLTVASLAANYARGQLDLARTLREDKARPFIIVDLDRTRGPGRPFMDLIIKNTGETIAKNVKLTFDPPLTTTLDETAQRATGHPLRDSTIFRQGIPSMPPGREYRILFEHMVDRYATDLPRQYSVRINFDSARGPEEPLEQTLDLDLFYGILQVDEHNTHHIAKTLRAWAKKNGVSSF